MAELITEEELQADVNALVEKFNCPTEFGGEALQKFMDSYQPLDIIESVPIFDAVFGRVTVALKLIRKGVVILILQRGKTVGE